MSFITKDFPPLDLRTGGSATNYFNWWMDDLARLFDIQCQAAKGMLDQQIKQFEILLSTTCAPERRGEASRLFSAGMEQAIDGMRKSGRLMMEMHTQLQQVAQQSLAELSQGLRDSGDTDVLTVKGTRQAA